MIELFIINQGYRSFPPFSIYNISILLKVTLITDVKYGLNKIVTFYNECKNFIRSFEFCEGTYCLPYTNIVIMKNQGSIKIKLYEKMTLIQ